MILKNCKLVPELTEANAPVMADVIVKGSLIEAVVPCGSADADGHEVRYEFICISFFRFFTCETLISFTDFIGV